MTEENIPIAPDTTPINIAPPNFYIPVPATTPPIPTAAPYYAPYQGSRIDVQRFDSRDRQMIELDKCLRRLKKKCEKDNIIKELKERQYYKKPSEVKREKVKNAKRLMEKNRKKAELYTNGNNYYPKRKEKENGSRFGTNSTTRTNENVSI